MPEMFKSVNPNLKRSPYYIVAPHYVRTSAGVRCLHMLCHWLNRMGERAFLGINQRSSRSGTNPDLQTPLLTTSIINYHYELGVRPIVVYSEVVAGNPLEADCVVRWVLNFPGLLGGNASYPETEMVIAFSRVLANAIKPGTPVLHMPVLNEEVFYPGTPRPRSGSAFYAAKYKEMHKGKIFGVPEDAIEITREQPNSQTPEEIAEIFRSVELLYVFENTALATEAVLCGCPAVFMPNPWLDKPIALEELGWDGIAWGNDPAEIARARATVEQGQVNYHRTIGQFFVQLNEFIVRSQAKAAAGRYEQKINPSVFVPLSADMRLLERWYRINREFASALFAPATHVRLSHELRVRLGHAVRVRLPRWRAAFVSTCTALLARRPVRWLFRSPQTMKADGGKGKSHLMP